MPFGISAWPSPHAIRRSSGYLVGTRKARPAPKRSFQITPHQRLRKNRNNSRIAGDAGNDGLDARHHGLVLGIAPVPTLGALKPFDIGERPRGRVFEPDHRRIAALECCLDVSGYLLRLLRRLRRLGAKAGRIAAVFVTRAFAPFVDVASADQVADGLRALPDRVAARIDCCLAPELCEVAGARG